MNHVQKTNKRAKQQTAPSAMTSSKARLTDGSSTSSQREKKPDKSGRFGKRKPRLGCSKNSPATRQQRLKPGLIRSNAMKKLIAVVVIGSMLGCAGTGSRFVPIVDGKQDGKYQTDLRECQAYADKLASAGDAAAAGAIVGAGIGLLFAIAGGGSRGYGLRNGMAGVGAVSGALGAAGKAETDQRSVISRCLAGRGHSVLN